MAAANSRWFSRSNKPRVTKTPPSGQPKAPIESLFKTWTRAGPSGASPSTARAASARRCRPSSWRMPPCARAQLAWLAAAPHPVVDNATSPISKMNARTDAARTTSVPPLNSAYPCPSNAHCRHATDKPAQFEGNPGDLIQIEPFEPLASLRRWRGIAASAPGRTTHEQTLVKMDYPWAGYSDRGTGCSASEPRRFLRGCGAASARDNFQ